MGDANHDERSSAPPRPRAAAAGPGPSQKTGWTLPLRAPEGGPTCPICGEPLRRWGPELFCDAALKQLASGWKE